MHDAMNDIDFLFHVGLTRDEAERFVELAGRNEKSAREYIDALRSQWRIRARVTAGEVALTELRRDAKETSGE